MSSSTSAAADDAASQSIEVPKSLPSHSFDGPNLTEVTATVAEIKLLGHRMGDYRTEDVLVDGDEKDVDFHQFGLSDEVIRGLAYEGFEKPSPIQLGAIPIGLSGIDMLLKAKSGTGKTCVFSVIALEKTAVSLNKIQALVISPCREIAVQTQFVIQSIGAFKNGLEVGLFIGGCSLTENIQQLSSCHIVVGTPGRIVHMIQEFGMDLSSVTLFVMDEVDKLFEPMFLDSISIIKEKLPSTVQTLAVSATFETGLEQEISAFLKNPVKVNSGVGGMSLLGVEQYAMDVRKVYNFEAAHDQSVKLEDIHRLKFRSIMDLLSIISYGQAVIFTEYQLKAERIYDQLRRENVDVVLLSGALCQSLRLSSFKQFQKEKVPILVATDLGARGLDYELVNLVINYECPQNLATYIHRMGRSGRFGSCGRVITLLGYGNELSMMTKFQAKLRANVNLILGVDDIKTLVNSPTPINDVPSSKKFTPITLPAGNAILSFAEALDFLETGGCEAFDFAATYCATSSHLDVEVDPAQFRGMVNDFMVKAKFDRIFQTKATEASQETQDSSVASKGNGDVEEGADSVELEENGN